MVFKCFKCSDEIQKGDDFYFLNPKNKDIGIDYDIITLNIEEVKKIYSNILLCSNCAKRLLEDQDVVNYGQCSLCHEKIIYYIEDLEYDEKGFALCKFEHKNEFKEN